LIDGPGIVGSKEHKRNGYYDPRESEANIAHSLY
jgi:hypothetical protein